MQTIEGSPALSFSQSDLGKVLKGAAIAAAGAALTWLAQNLSGMDFGPWTLVVVPIASTLVNAALKWLTNTEAVKVTALILAAILFGSSAQADEFPTPAASDPAHVLTIPVEQRQWFRNPDGSCVQCSNGMAGMQLNVPQFSTLLWDTDYGPKVRGGSWPGRVAEYAKSRGVRIWNVTGANTWDWMRWACATGRPCAIGAGGSHFQTLAGYEPASKKWFVCNNNSPQKIDEYSDDGFRRLHLASGQWCVILDYPATAAAPAYAKWW